MSWQELTGSRVRLNDTVARVVHVDSFRVVLRTEPQEERAQTNVSKDGVHSHPRLAVGGGTRRNAAA